MIATFIRIAAIGFAAMVALAAGGARAADDTYPSRPVRIIVGFPPGQTVDVMARALSALMAKRTGKEFYVENRPGAAGIIGMQAAKNAPPDGYTLVYTSTGPLSINPWLYKKLPYDPVKDYTPIAMTGSSALYLAANLSFPANNLQELLAYVKANPGKVSYGSGGVGITAHLAMEMFKSQAGLDILHVPYKGSTQALNDLIAGQVQLMMDAGATVVPMARAGKIKLIGVASAERVPSASEFPTLAEQGMKGFAATASSGLLGPANLPPAIVEKLAAEVARAARSSEFDGVLKTSGAQLLESTPASYANFVKSELAKWGQAAKAAGIEPE